MLSDVYQALNAACKQRGAQAEFARQLGVSEAYISQMVNSSKPLSDDLIAALGFKRVEMFQRIK